MSHESQHFEIVALDEMLLPKDRGLDAVDMRLRLFGVSSQRACRKLNSVEFHGRDEG